MKQYVCPMHSEVQSNTPGTCPKCGMKLIEKSIQKSAESVKNQKNITLFTCPMDPDVIREHPGTCPKCGMKLVSLTTNHEAHENHASMEHDFRKRFFLTMPFVLLTIILSPNIQKWFGFGVSFVGLDWFVFTISAFIFIYGGLPFFQAAKGELTHRNPGMMTLVAFAISIGFSFSVAATFLFSGESMYWEISTLISVFLLGHWLEMRAVRGATGALSELAKLIPPTAHRMKNGKITDVQTSEVAIGDSLLVKPGEKIPIDAIVIDGISSINESMVTGESRPVVKEKNALVIGGTINQDGSLTIQVTKTGSDTAISQIMKLIREAQASKPNVQHLADKAAGVLFYIAMFGGITTFIYWYFISPQGAVFAATLAVSAIVVACPHALGLAIPTVTTITSMLGAKNGILIKEMKGLEIARKIDYVVFDKTGTLTSGEFGVKRIEKSTSSKITENELLALAGSVEVKSQHSIAQGIVNEVKKRNMTLFAVSNFKSFPGKGARGTVNKKTVDVGNATYLSDLHIDIPDNLTESKGNTPVYLVIDSTFAAVIYLSDMIRDESKNAIARLHTMGIKTAMLTGDAQDVAEAVGKTLSVDTIFAQVLPDDKVNKVKELQLKGHIVAMVGDGVNDAPSLTQAHVGIAIGAGTDVAVESADIVLMKNNPLDVVKAIHLSRKTNEKMVQNLIWATGYNIIAIPMAAGVFYSTFGIILRPEWAALLMSASSVIVVFNALLLRKAGI